MKRSGPPERRQPLRSSSPLKRTRMRESPEARERHRAHVARMAELRPLVFARAAWSCERCGRSEALLHAAGLALEAHHRKPLGRGGGDTLANLVALCGPNPRGCHGLVHQHPEQGAAEGLLIASWEEAPSEPWEAPDGGRFLASPP